jgi:DNA-directed RNA polymerase subunit RPC12/RpoP
MLEHSVYIAACLCGRHFESPTREYVCPDCHRHIVLEWDHNRDLKKADAQVSAPEAA